MLVATENHRPHLALLSTHQSRVRRKGPIATTAAVSLTTSQVPHLAVLPSTGKNPGLWELLLKIRLPKAARLFGYVFERFTGPILRRWCSR